jgi:hypothetical protein
VCNPWEYIWILSSNDIEALLYRLCIWGEWEWWVEGVCNPNKDSFRGDCKEFLGLEGKNSKSIEVGLTIVGIVCEGEGVILEAVELL